MLRWRPRASPFLDGAGREARRSCGSVAGELAGLGILRLRNTSAREAQVGLLFRTAALGTPWRVVLFDVAVQVSSGP